MRRKVTPLIARIESVESSTALPLQRAWGLIGAASAVSLLSAIAGPLATDANGAVVATPVDPSASVAAAPVYIYLAPGEHAPDGAPVVYLDPLTIVGAPQPGSVTVAPRRKTIYLYLQPGETPPPGAIVREAGRIPVVPATTAPSSAGTTATPKPTAAPVATPRPATPPPPPPPPVTKPSGA